MKIKCSICKKSFDRTKVRFVKCPKNDHLRKLWSDYCGENLSKSSKICMYHFNDSDYIQLPEDGKPARLLPTALPSPKPNKAFVKLSSGDRFLYNLSKKPQSSAGASTNVDHSINIKSYHVAEDEDQQTTLGDIKEDIWEDEVENLAGTISIKMERGDIDRCKSSIVKHIEKTPVKKVVGTKHKKSDSISSSSPKPPIVMYNLIKIKEEKPEMIISTLEESVSAKPVPPKEFESSECDENKMRIYEIKEKLIKTEELKTQGVSFNCVLCPYKTSKKILFSNHLRTHSDDHPYKCSVCGVSLKTKGSLRSHLNSQHPSDKVHACKDCEKTCATKGDLARHVRYCHSSIKPNKCTECDYSCVDKRKFQLHIRSHTGGEISIFSNDLKSHSDDRSYKCSLCEKCFKTKGSLRHHVNSIHLRVKSSHNCQDCGKSCNARADLIRHIRYRHSHIKPHKCTVCDYSCVERSKLLLHMRSHTGEKPYQCDHCDYGAKDMFKLKCHLRMHTGEKPFKCDICHKGFIRKIGLRSHKKKLHSSEQPLPCKLCDKELPDQHAYKVHMKMHKDEKYCCTHCPYETSVKRSLELHLLAHTNTEPNVCEICKIAFRHKQHLTRHIKFNHPDNCELPGPSQIDDTPKKRPHCDKAFASNGYLMQHMETHYLSTEISKRSQKLRMVHLKRMQPDGSVVTVRDYKNDYYSHNEEYIHGESEEINEEELNEAYHVIDDENNKWQIEYVNENFQNEELSEIVPHFEIKTEEPTMTPILQSIPNVEIKIEEPTMTTAPQLTSILQTVMVKQEIEDSEFIAS